MLFRSRLAGRAVVVGHDAGRRFVGGPLDSSLRIGNRRHHRPRRDDRRHGVGMRQGGEGEDAAVGGAVPRGVGTRHFDVIQGVRAEHVEHHVMHRQEGDGIDRVGQIQRRSVPDMAVGGLVRGPGDDGRILRDSRGGGPRQDHRRRGIRRGNGTWAGFPL